MLLPLLGGYAIWSPGSVVTDGRHDLGRNGIWIQHGWLGSDEWFANNFKTAEIPRFRDTQRIRELAERLRAYHIINVFPHMCPTTRDGRIQPINDEQAERFLKEMNGFHVMAWVGGAAGIQAFPEDSKWRKLFADSIRELLERHPGFAGIHIDIEPCPSGNGNFLLLLDAVRSRLPDGKILSIAAYPPPTVWHSFPDVHWDEEYYRQVAVRVDQMVVMMYDTALKYDKLYINLMASWTREVIDWSTPTHVLLGLPAYDDAGVGYHAPGVENLSNGLGGIHSGLRGYAQLPENFDGVAIYSEWEIDEREWRIFEENFLKPGGR